MRRYISSSKFKTLLHPNSGVHFPCRVSSVVVSRISQRLFRTWSSPTPLKNRPTTASKGHSVFPKRNVNLDALPTHLLLPPLAFLGFFLALWAYKCVIMVLFQHKIIYMPYLPPGSRQLKISDFQQLCGSIAWQEKRIKSLDDTEIALCIGEDRGRLVRDTTTSKAESKHVVILYFQGNGSSLPPRLPMLSQVLVGLQNATSSHGGHTTFTLAAVSYRGYWTSRGRASQRGIEQDAFSALTWVQTNYASPSTRIVIWGQSIGAGVASCCLNAHLHDANARTSVSGIIMETPFISIKNMLIALYPQKWLPYRYLWPFLLSHWDSDVALRGIATVATEHALKVPVCLIVAEKDELVPKEHADHLANLCKDLGLDVSRVDARGALHVDAMSKASGRQAVVDFVTEKVMTQ